MHPHAWYQMVSQGYTRSLLGVDALKNFSTRRVWLHIHFGGLGEVLKIVLDFSFLAENYRVPLRLTPTLVVSLLGCGREFPLKLAAEVLLVPPAAPFSALPLLPQAQTSFLPQFLLTFVVKNEYGGWTSPHLGFPKESVHPAKVIPAYLLVSVERHSRAEHLPTEATAEVVRPSSPLELSGLH